MSLRVMKRIKTILTTPKGSVCHSPEFGSLIYTFLDRPINRVRAKIIAAAYRDLARWIPDLKIKEISCSAGDEGLTLSISGQYLSEEITNEIRL